VQGAALSCVIIDRLPFAAPSDPVMQARIQDMSSRGISAFSQLQLPQAVIGLKQGAGRLIRGEQDRGLLVICDPRLYSQRYGQVFLDSLPPMPRTRDLSVAEGFLHTLD
jgi:ATP-dependent DNA helicase DinG